MKNRDPRFPSKSRYSTRPTAIRRGLAVKLARAAATADSGNPRSWARALAVPIGMMPRATLLPTRPCRTSCDGTVASAGKDRVATCGDGMMRLRGCIRLAARRFDAGLDTCLPQYCQCPLYLRQSSRTSPARQRVVEENGLAHGKRGMKTEIGNQMDCTGTCRKPPPRTLHPRTFSLSYPCLGALVVIR